MSVRKSKTSKSRKNKPNTNLTFASKAKKKSKDGVDTIGTTTKVIVGLETEMETLNQALLADMSDLLVAPEVIRWIKTWQERRAYEKLHPNKRSPVEDEYWDRTAKGIMRMVGRGLIIAGGFLALPLGIALHVLSFGENTKRFLEDNRERLENDKEFQKAFTTQVGMVLDNITVTTGTGERIERVVKTE